MRKKKDEDSSALDALNSALQTSKERNNAPYDGVMGVPPHWLPDPLNQEFFAVRGKLLDLHGQADVLKFMAGRKAMFDTSRFFIPFYPPQIENELDALIYIKHISDLGKEDGINAYLGRRGAEVYRAVVWAEHNRQAAKQPRKNALQEQIILVVGRKPQSTWKEVLKALPGGAFRETNGGIEWTDARGRVRTTSLSALKDRVSRAKKFLNSR